MTSTEDEITLLLAAWHDGDPDALGRLMPLVYSELRRLAVHSLAVNDRRRAQPSSSVL